MPQENGSGNSGVYADMMPFNSVNKADAALMLILQADCNTGAVKSL